MKGVSTRPGAVVIASLAAGCLVDRTDLVTITLRDPSRIAVASPDGVLLPIGSDQATIPAAAFVERPEPDATIERSAERGLVVTCPHCRGVEADRIVGGCARSALVDGHPQCLDRAAPEIVLHDVPRAVQFTGGDLYAHYTFFDRVPSKRGSYLDPRLQLELVTPADNVVAIRAERRRAAPCSNGCYAAIFGVGVVLAVVGIVGGGFGIRDGDVALAGAAGLSLAIGTVTAAYAWTNWHAVDEAWTIAVPAHQ
jgi:hypothetical protein